MELLAIDLGLRESVHFLGPLYGEAKLRALAGADCFVLPSLSEGFSMVALEAAACGLSALLTPQCNFPELAAAGGAFEAQPTVEGCELGLRKIFSLSDEQRLEMGARGRRLVQAEYTWRGVATQLASVYTWLLGQGPKPDCVRLN
jgi:poly(glycerol-phosphate) alpha-glucosyltransferase